MAIADWLREHTARSLAKWEAEMRTRRLEAERANSRAYQASYNRGYNDAMQGKPRLHYHGKGSFTMPMNATAVSHVAVCVRDLDASLRFYCDILGMSIVSDVIQDTTTGGLPHVYSHRRSARRQVRLAYAHGAKPTLTMTSHPGENPDGAPIKLDQVGISHTSFTVPDPKALAESLSEQGVPLAAPLPVWTNPQGKVSSFYVYDPDGILIQFDAGD